MTGLLDVEVLAGLVNGVTRLVTVPHCSNVVGQENDVAAITRVAHEVGARVVVDGVSFAIVCPDIVVDEKTQVVDAVTHHGDPVDSQAERESGVNVRIDAHRLEDRGVDHPRPTQLDPAAALAGAAALSGADLAGDVVLAAGFHEREVAGPQPHAHLLAVEPLPHGAQRSLEVGHGHAFADHERLELMEHRQVRGVQVAAVLISIAYAAIVTLIILVIVNKITRLRALEYYEMAGLDHATMVNTDMEC